MTQFHVITKAGVQTVISAGSKRVTQDGLRLRFFDDESNVVAEFMNDEIAGIINDANVNPLPSSTSVALSAAAPKTRSSKTKSKTTTR